MDNMTLRHQRLHATFYSDTLFSGVKSLHGNKCAQVTWDPHPCVSNDLKVGGR